MNKVVLLFLIVLFSADYVKSGSELLAEFTPEELKAANGISLDHKLKEEKSEGSSSKFETVKEKEDHEIDEIDKMIPDVIEENPNEQKSEKL